MSSYDSNDEEHKMAIVHFFDNKDKIEKLIERLVTKTNMSDKVIRQFVNECESEKAVNLEQCVEDKINKALTQKPNQPEGQDIDEHRPEDEDTKKPEPEGEDTKKPSKKKTKPRLR